MRHLSLSALLILLVASVAVAGDVRVMTFNVRTSNAVDGLNSWPLRRMMFYRTITHFDPDLLGMQEVTPFQTQDISANLKGYELLGLPRDDGKTRGERAAVLFKRDRFDKVRDGTFWLSETPDVVGSKGWDAALPRVCSWVELRDRQNDNRTIYFFNTHFDHKGPKAREESAKLMREKIKEIAGDNPVVITGDFNTGQSSPPFKDLTDDRFTEAFAETHPKPTTQDFTFHAFTGQSNKGGIRIDWILHSAQLRATSAQIDRSSENGRYPSDHFPVEAVLSWRDDQAATRPAR